MVSNSFKGLGFMVSRVFFFVVDPNLLSHLFLQKPVASSGSPRSVALSSPAITILVIHNGPHPHQGQHLRQLRLFEIRPNNLCQDSPQNLRFLDVCWERFVNCKTKKRQTKTPNLAEILFFVQHPPTQLAGALALIACAPMPARPPLKA